MSTEHRLQVEVMNILKTLMVTACEVDISSVLVMKYIC